MAKTIEIAVCESVFENIVSRGTKKGEPTFLYHVEVRFVPEPGAHSICLQGERHRDRERANTEKKTIQTLIQRTKRARAKAKKAKRARRS